ncbi:hypothetical protein [Frigidibacter sp. MR17.24]|uniref:hypothetical protein n=1 Tax=Frigidibacter sp. MR17.24 TaxID=3127345 RepID=UPI003012F30B
MTITTEEAERMAAALLDRSYDPQEKITHILRRLHVDRLNASKMIRALALDRDTLAEAVGADFSAATDYSERWERACAERDALRKERDHHEHWHMTYRDMVNQKFEHIDSVAAHQARIEGHRAGMLAAAEMLEGMELRADHDAMVATVEGDIISHRERESAFRDAAKVVRAAVTEGGAEHSGNQRHSQAGKGGTPAPKSEGGA